MGAKFRPVESVHLYQPYSPKEVTSSIPASDEYWAILQTLVTTNDLQDRTLREAKALIDQAERYWQSAQQVHSHYQSSVLLYYYCFLQLTKAFMVLKRHCTYAGKFGYHGLAAPPAPRNQNFSSWAVTVKQDGIFQDYWKARLPDPPPQSLRVEAAMAYIMDIGFQYSRICNGPMRAVGYKLKLVTYENGKHGLVFIVEKSSRFWMRYKDFPKFTSTFEHVTEGLPTDLTQKSLLGLLQMDYSRYAIYQFREAALEDSPSSVPRSFKAVFGNRTCFSLYSDAYDGVINVAPTKRDQGAWMNEELAIFLVFFYLADRVRYQPADLDELLHDRYGVLVKACVNNAPTRFLHSLCSQMVGHVLHVKTQ